MDNSSGLMAEYMKGSSAMICSNKYYILKGMDRVHYLFQMEGNIQESGKTINNQELENLVIIILINFKY